jgi:hypothetical protein
MCFGVCFSSSLSPIHTRTLARFPQRERLRQAAIRATPGWPSILSKCPEIEQNASPPTENSFGRCTVWLAVCCLSSRRSLFFFSNQDRKSEGNLSLLQQAIIAWPKQAVRLCCTRRTSNSSSSVPAPLAPRHKPAPISSAQPLPPQSRSRCSLHRAAARPARSGRRWRVATEREFFAVSRAVGSSPICFPPVCCRCSRVHEQCSSAAHPSAAIFSRSCGR